MIERESGFDVGDVGKDAIYEVADAIYQEKESIESHLVASTARLYPGGRLLLFDLTKVYLEGSAKANALAAYGHSKEKRDDLALISLALLVDDRGFPVYSHVYAGNQSEPGTLSDVLDAIDAERRGSSSVMMDRGIATEANIALLARRNYSYLVITRSDEARAHLEAFSGSKEGFCQLERTDDHPVWVRTLEPDDENSTKIAVISELRKAKEQAIDQSRTKRCIADLARLSVAIDAGTYRVPKTVRWLATTRSASQSMRMRRSLGSAIASARTR